MSSVVMTGTVGGVGSPGVSPRRYPAAAVILAMYGVDPERDARSSAGWHDGRRVEMGGGLATHRPHDREPGGAGGPRPAAGARSPPLPQGPGGPALAAGARAGGCRPHGGDGRTCAY